MPARLIYSALTSLDGYLADAEGAFDWAAPDDEVHAFVNDRERQVHTFLIGRRMYDYLMYWETVPTDSGPPIAREFAQIWQSSDKVVYSRTLDTPPTARTRIARQFDADEVRRLKQSADHDLSIGGAQLAAEAFRAGLVDEIQLYLNPILVGGGQAALPADVRLPLQLLDERRFGNGTVFLRYSCSAPPAE